MAKGHKTGGRKKGTPNKLSSTVRDNVVAVFDGLGGTSHMLEWARTNPSEFYRLYGKMLPQGIELAAEAPIVSRLIINRA